jgi:hypothetical protein
LSAASPFALLQTFEKKKAMTKLSIPLLLDMGDVLQGAGVAVRHAAPLGPDASPLLPGSPGCGYELAAVLIHKGTSASHGHYGEGAASVALAGWNVFARLLVDAARVLVGQRSAVRQFLI